MSPPLCAHPPPKRRRRAPQRLPALPRLRRVTSRHTVACHPSLSRALRRWSRCRPSTKPCPNPTPNRRCRLPPVITHTLHRWQWRVSRLSCRRRLQCRHLRLPLRPPPSRSCKSSSNSKRLQSPASSCSHPSSLRRRLSHRSLPPLLPLLRRFRACTPPSTCFRVPPHRHRPRLWLPPTLQPRPRLPSTHTLLPTRQPRHAPNKCLLIQQSPLPIASPDLTSPLPPAPSNSISMPAAAVERVA
jgi:hypothetical protein